ncbi:hypothetical protein K502DRAFT_110125 [Neoconidiobolus thromboides FSU 785]|nr:hypothetical protein K502DRAFT_110125 [Neoconidiobolus thromboides FSU 785]
MPKFTSKPNNNNSIDKLCSRMEALSLADRITSKDMDQLVGRVHSLTLNETKSTIQQKLNHKRNKKMIQTQTDKVLAIIKRILSDKVENEKDAFTCILNKRKQVTPCYLEFIAISKKYHF